MNKKIEVGSSGKKVSVMPPARESAADIDQTLRLGFLKAIAILQAQIDEIDRRA